MRWGSRTRLAGSGTIGALRGAVASVPSIALCALLAGCNAVNDFIHLTEEEQPIGPPQWREGHVMDLGTLDEALLPAAGNDSYHSFTLAGSDDRAALIVDAPYGGLYRVFGRIFYP